MRGNLTLIHQASIMSKFPKRRILIISSLIAIATIFILAFSAFSLGNQINEAKKRVIDLQSQVAYYENMTNTLQNKASSLESQIKSINSQVDNLESQKNELKSQVNSLESQKNGIESQVNSLKNPTYNITLTIASVGNWHPDPIGGCPYQKYIIITLRNTGTLDVGGLTLYLKPEENVTNINYLDIYVTSGFLGVLHVQESKNMTILLVTYTTDETSALSAYSLLITAMLDKTVLDRQTTKIGA